MERPPLRFPYLLPDAAFGKEDYGCIREDPVALPQWLLGAWYNGPGSTVIQI